ncbi:hypothetical protein VKT23_004609 [Stygiomarasmius scandens]|uniref:Uncharacterized protein n=1 Tax=Marasmiellus scandens TaxID=2682957 RepID=A0ABR1JYW6_9AGAR
MNMRRISSYRKHLKYWVDHLHKLYPHTEEHRERPNIHAAGHIYDFLVEFGPMLSWWCFPFERLIGTLQRLNTNEHIGGPLEQTIMESQTRAANIRRWLGRPDCPQVIKEVKRLFDKAFVPINSDFEYTDDPSPGQSLLHYRSDGITFSCSAVHAGNATIVYRVADSPGRLAGQIQHIFATNHSVVFHVRRQAPAAANHFDPFKRYPHFPARIYSSYMADIIDVVFPEDVVSHGARYDFADGRSVVCDLTRD